MTGSDDSHSDSRPISVAELLAKNGSIGAPPIGGRRRRRRGNADAVSVAELTGEIPIIRPDDPDPSAANAAGEEQLEKVDTETETELSSSAADQAETDDQAATEAATEAETDADAEAEAEVTDEGAEVAADASDVADDVEVPEVPEQDAEVPEQDADLGVLEPETEDLKVPEPVTEDLEVVKPDTDAGSGEGVTEKSAGEDVDDDYADAVAEYAAHLEHRGADPDPVVSAPPKRFGFLRKASKKAKEAKEAKQAEESEESLDGDAAAEQMNPDPPEDGDSTDVLDSPGDLLESPVDEVAPPEIEELDSSVDVAVAPDAEDSDELPSYLRSTQEPLFGGPTVADDIARRGTHPVSGDLDLDDVEDLEDDEDAADYDEPRRMSSLVTGLWIVGQSVLAVMLGAGLFVAFDQLWKWNNIIALVLSVLVILGLVVAVRVVRKTEDIASTLIAVAVGALVTLGPLALLQSG